MSSSCRAPLCARRCWLFQEKLAAVGLALGDADDEAALEPLRGLQAGRHALEPLAALLLLRGLAVARAFCPRLELRRIARQHPRVEHAERLALLAQKQRGVQQQAEGLVRIVADGPQPARARMSAQIERRGVLHREQHGQAVCAPEHRLAVRGQHRRRLDGIVVEKPAGRLGPGPAPRSLRDGSARLGEPIGGDLFQAAIPARVSEIEGLEFILRPEAVRVGIIVERSGMRGHPRIEYRNNSSYQCIFCLFKRPLASTF